MRFRQSMTLAALVVATGSPAVAVPVVYELTAGTTEFSIDLNDGTLESDRGIASATFTLDGTTLTAFSIVGIDGTTLILNGTGTLSNSGGFDLEINSAEATLNLGTTDGSTSPRRGKRPRGATPDLGSTSIIQLLSGQFETTDLTVQFSFSGGGTGSFEDPAVSALQFTAASVGSTTGGSPMPEPSGLLLFGVGLLLTAHSLRTRSE